MSELSSLSDAELLALYNKPDLSSMSDADLLKAYGAAPKDEPSSSMGGVVKSLGVGAAEGLIGIAGLPGDLYNLAFGEAGKESDYGSASFKKQIEGMTGEFYKPKGRAEQFANTAGQFLPAVVGGPETLALKLATRVAVPAAASEAAGALTGDNPYAKVGGALAGAAGASAAARKFQSMLAARQGASSVPSADDLLKTASSQFDQARDMNLVVKPDFATNASADMRASLRGFDPEAQGTVFKAADRLEGLGASGPGLPPVAIPMNDVELIRKQLVSLKTSPDASVREAAREAIKSLQRSQTGLTPAEVLSGDAGDYTKLVGDAVGNWAAGKRSNTVMGKVALGDLNAATAGSGANEDNALRQAIKQLVRPVNNDIVPKAQRLGFNAAEIAGLNKVARGTVAGNTARYLGKLAPTGSVSGVLGGGAGYALGGPVGAIGLPAAGYLAKKIGDMSTKHAVFTVDSLVRSRSPLAAQVAAQLPPQIIQQLPPKSQRILQALVLSDPVLSQQPRQTVGQPAS